MTRVLIVSDIHGYKERLTRILENESFDYAISLGDSECTLEELKSFDTIIHGNHFLDVGVASSIIHIENFDLYVCHGHFEKVHVNDEGIIKKMIKQACDLAFHGHTHVARVKSLPFGSIINPGAVSHSRSSDPESYITAVFDKNDCHLVFKDLNHSVIRSHSLHKGY